MKTVQCPNCGASFEVANPRKSAQCPYCGSMVDTPKPASSQDNPETSSDQCKYLPFKVSEDEAVGIMMQQLINTEGVPTDVFNGIENITVNRYRLPMFLYEGNLDVSWTAQSVVWKERKYTDKNGNRRTESYKEYYPISGNGYGGINLLFLAHEGNDIPEQLRDFASDIDYSDTLERAFMTEEEWEEKNADSVISIEENVTERQIWKSDQCNSRLNETARLIAHNQISGEYVDLRTSWNANYHRFERMMRGFYFISFEYQGVRYECSVDALDGMVCNMNVPEGESPCNESALKSKRYTKWAWLYSILALFFCVGSIYSMISMPRCWLRIVADIGSDAQ